MKSAGEAAQMQLIDKLGLVREIRHVRFWDEGTSKKKQPITVPGKKEIRRPSGTYISGGTFCELYTKEDHPAYKEWQKEYNKWKSMDTMEDNPECPVNPVAKGESKCSVSDNFNKQTGRIIATTRAIQQYLQNMKDAEDEHFEKSALNQG